MSFMKLRPIFKVSVWWM